MQTVIIVNNRSAQQILKAVMKDSSCKALKCNMMPLSNLDLQMYL